MNMCIRYCILLLLFISPQVSFGQKERNEKIDFCDKKWVVEKYQEVSGDLFPPPKEAKHDYLIYRFSWCQVFLPDTFLREMSMRKG